MVHTLTSWMMKTKKCSNGFTSSSNIPLFLSPWQLNYNILIYICIYCSKYDLYTKSKVRVDVEKVKPYYLSLIEKVWTFLHYFTILLLSASFQLNFRAIFYCSISQLSSDGEKLKDIFRFMKGWSINILCKHKYTYPNIVSKKGNTEYGLWLYIK